MNKQLCKTCSESGYCTSPCNDSLKVALHNDSDYKKEKLKQDPVKRRMTTKKSFSYNRPLDFN